MTIKGRRITYQGAGEHAITLDARGGKKWFDVVFTADGYRHEYRGLYSIEGDTLTTCLIRSDGESDRPKDLSGKQPGQWLEVYKRVKR